MSDGAVINCSRRNEYMLGAGVWVACYCELGNYLTANDCKGGTHGSVVDGSTGFFQIVQVDPSYRDVGEDISLVRGVGIVHCRR